MITIKEANKLIEMAESLDQHYWHSDYINLVIRKWQNTGLVELNKKDEVLEIANDIINLKAPLTPAQYTVDFAKKVIKYFKDEE